MRVLVIAAKDSSNFAMAKVAKELKSRGHEVLIYDTNLSKVNIRMFRQAGLQVHLLDELTDDVVESCDIMFGHTTYIRNKKISKKLYTFFCNHIFVYGHENETDFVFTQCDDPYNTFPNKVVMKVGSPKMDRLHTEIVPAEESKRILFIETGHFPFIEEGRMQVARLILDICEKCKDYTITVKPRFLPTDTKNLTRKNTDHIYKYIYEQCNNKLPSNLELLMEHHDLDEYIYQSHSIVCYASSSYLEAAISGRGVIYVDGIKTLDAIGDRQSKYWKAFNNFIRDSGIVVPYEKALDYLPDGIKCSERHLSKVLYSRENTVPRIVDVVEYVWENFLSKGLFPANGHYEYENYQETLRCDEKLTLEGLEANNVYDMLIYDIQWVMQSIGADLSFEPVFAEVNKWRKMMEFSEKRKSELRKKLSYVISRYVTDNEDLLMQNKIDQAILMQHYARLGEYNKIERLPFDMLEAKDAYFYYMGLHYCEEQDEKALDYWNKYLEYLKKTTFEESQIYRAQSVIEFYQQLFLYACQKKNMQIQENILCQMDELSEIYQYAVSNYEMKCAMICQEKGYDAAVELLVLHWLSRNHDEFSKYEEVENNEQAYKYLSEFYERNKEVKKAEHAKQKSMEYHKQKMKLREETE